MSRPKQIAYYLAVLLFCSCGILKDSTEEKAKRDEYSKKAFSTLISNGFMLSFFLSDSVEAIYEESSLEPHTPIHIHTLNASFVGRQGRPFDISATDIRVTKTIDSMELGKLINNGEMIMATYQDGRTHPFHLIYLGSDTSAINVSCSYSYENSRDSIKALQLSYALNGDPINGGCFLRLNPDGSSDTLLPLKQQPPAGNEDDFSVAYKLNKKGEWEIRHTPLPAS